MLLAKDALRDPSSEFQGPLQEVGRRIMKLASLIELDQAVLTLVRSTAELFDCVFLMKPTSPTFSL